MRNQKQDLLTDYDQQASYFARLPEYAMNCGTDFVAVNEAPAIIQAVKPLKKILDIGCGTGLATRFLKKHFSNCEVIGADINKVMLEQAKEADPSGDYVYLEKNENVINYTSLPADFDVIVSSFMLHENKTYSDLQDFLKVVPTLLRPQGLFLAWDAYKNLFTGRWSSIESVIGNENIQDGENYTVKLLPAGAQVTGTYWSPKAVANIAEEFGLKHLKTSFPTAMDNGCFNWKDEIHSAPYYVISAIKSS